MVQMGIRVASRATWVANLLTLETHRRQENATYLSQRLGQIPGIHPARLPDNSKGAWHLFPFRYDPARFHGLPKDRFIRALNAEGVACGGGYQEQYFDGLLDEAIESRGYKRLFSAQRLKAYRESFQELKQNSELCATTVAMTQNLLLAERSAMDDIINAVTKIHAHSAELAKT